MFLVSGGGRTRWIATGVFLLYSVLIVMASDVILPAAMLYPGAYCLYARRMPLKWALLVASSPLVLGVIPAFTMGAFLYCVLFVSAMTLHMFLRRGSVGLAIGVPAMLIFGFVMASLFSLARENAISVQGVISRWADTVAGESLRASETMLSGAELNEFKDMISVMKERIIMLFPSIVLTGSAFFLWLNLVVVSVWTHGLSLREWKSPDWLIGGFIIAGAFTVIPLGSLPVIGINLLIIVCVVYFFQGLAIMSVFMGERGWPAFIRWPIYILILIQIYMMVIVAGLGLFDAWFDFRTRIRTPKGDKE
ncbi:MAG TPA: DUF2232 domain-containing protein [Deltaproteobacteria bacterium]|nr:DUF2232 domain-containing protein [Deltaproteobacteria bacterium]HXK46131.1 DUF2232 domain-containing protein [Deltaproteobacteria bacterium]